jgi:hypothetical protein
MSDDKKGNSVSELKTTGVLAKKGVEIAKLRLAPPSRGSLPRSS